LSSSAVALWIVYFVLICGLYLEMCRTFTSLFNRCFPTVGRLSVALGLSYTQLQSVSAMLSFSACGHVCHLAGPCCVWSLYSLTREWRFTRIRGFLCSIRVVGSFMLRSSFRSAHRLMVDYCTKHLFFHSTVCSWQWPIVSFGAASLPGSFLTAVSSGVRVCFFCGLLCVHFVLG
jgi:hypothetical protein